MDNFLKSNTSASTNPNDELAIVAVEEEEPANGISEEEKNIDINVDDNNVSGSENLANSSGANTQSASVNEQPSYNFLIFMIQEIGIILIIKQETY